MSLATEALMAGDAALLEACGESLTIERTVGGVTQTFTVAGIVNSNAGANEYQRNRPNSVNFQPDDLTIIEVPSNAAAGLLFAGEKFLPVGTVLVDSKGYRHRVQAQKNIGTNVKYFCRTTS